MGRTWGRSGVVVMAVAVLVSCGRSHREGGDASPPAVSTTVAGATGSTSTTEVASTTSAPGEGAGPAIANAETTVHPTVDAPATPIEGSVRTPDGRDRTYRVYVPASVAASEAPVPLLIALHGGLGWGAQFERNSGYDGLAEANGFIVVYPDGFNAGTEARPLRTWNGGACCGPAARLEIDDVAFIDLLIDRLVTDQPVDPAQVVVTGHSNGGILALRLGCELTDRIVAIGVQSSALEVEGCAPSRPVSVLQIHGAADQNLPIDGGVGEQAVSGVDFEPPRDAASTFSRADECASPHKRTAPSNPDVTATVWAPCDAGTDVVFTEVAGATHAWMGHPTGGSGLTGAPYEGLDSSLVIWDFLSGHLDR